MKYYRLLPNLEYKGCYVENENTLNLIKSYYDGTILNRVAPIEVSFNSDNRNKYLVQKNILSFWGSGGEFVIDEYTKNKLESHYNDFFSFINVISIDDDIYKNKNLYLLYIKKTIDGLDREKSKIKFLNDDYFVLYNHARLTSIFKFKNLKNSTFCDERFKEFVEEQNIEGWIFREAFEK